ncbi:ankyrin repeat-containing domain protein [Halenospora varia]|nr:ankyrin repeat-containing domain protein [Halenospora varia]
MSHSLQSLPLEIFRQVLDEIVDAVGVFEAARLRIVCKLFEREMPESLCNTRAFENAPYIDLYFGSSCSHIVEEYIFNRVLSDKKSSTNLSLRLFNILEAILPEVNPSSEQFKTSLRTLITAVCLNSNSHVPGERNIKTKRGLEHLCEGSAFYLTDRKYYNDWRRAPSSHNINQSSSLKVDEGFSRFGLHQFGMHAGSAIPLPVGTFERDCLHAATLLGLSKYFDEIIANMLATQRKMNIVYSVPDGSIFCNTSLALAAQGGHSELVASILDVMHTAEWLPLHILEVLHLLPPIVRAGHENIVRQVLDPKYGDSACIEGRDSRWTEELIAIIGSTSNPSLFAFLCSHFGIHKAHTGIVRALAENGNMATLELSLMHGGSVSQAPYGKESPLAAAALHGHIDIVRLLLARGARVNVRFNEHQPLLFAARGGHKDIVQLLLDSGAIPISDPKHSPLGKAAANGHFHITSLLSLDLDIRNEHKAAAEEALWDSACAGYESIVRLLIERGVNPEAEGRYCYDGRKAMMQALMFGHPHVVATLIELGAEPIVPSERETGEFRNGFYPRSLEMGVKAVIPPFDPEAVVVETVVEDANVVSQREVWALCAEGRFEEARVVTEGWTEVQEVLRKSRLRQEARQGGGG